MIHNYCAPNNETNEKDEFTCFSSKALEQIALAFNIYIQTNKICNKNKCVPMKLIDTYDKSKKELWNEIHSRLSKLCNKEYCWLDFDFINQINDPYLIEQIKYFTFKPKMIGGMQSWLSTNDINAILNQYQLFDKEFKFLGAVPSDIHKITKVHFNQAKDYSKMGLVFNLDTHDLPGSHWVALFVDNINKTIEYFDSGAKPPTKNINEFINKFLLN